MYIVMKPAALLFGTTLLAATGFAGTSLAAATSACTSDLHMMRNQLDNAPSGPPLDRAQALYSSALRANSRGETGLCISDLDIASSDLAEVPFGPPDSDNGGDSTFLSAPAPDHHHAGEHGHDHHGRVVAMMR